MLKTVLQPILEFLFPTPEDIIDFETHPNTELLPPSDNTIPNCHSLFAYHNEKVKHLVWEIKYYRNKKVADQVGKLIAQKILQTIPNTRETILIPVPLTKQRLKERGFNHTELLSASVLAHLPNNFMLAPDSVEKIRHTPKQNSIENREDRFKNIQNTFQVSNPEAIKEKSTIIIDDVVTTGATVNEVRNVLLKAGAAGCTIFTIAH